MSLALKILVQINWFWARPANKIALQKLCCIFLKDETQSKNLKAVLPLNCDGSISPWFKYRKELSLFLEEADNRIMPHIYYNILNGGKPIVAISNDTDCHLYGTGSYTQMLPMHIMHVTLNMKCARCFFDYLRWWDATSQAKLEPSMEH